jgi:hypothetical protein
MPTWLPRGAIVLAVFVAAGGVAGTGAAQPFGAGAVCPPRPVCGVVPGAAVTGVGGSFGNGGFAAGYAMQVSRAGWFGGLGGGWCGQPAFASACPPRWCGPCWPSFSGCAPWGGWSFGRPGCGLGGWYGGSRFFGSQTLVIGGFGGRLFSGAAVPCATPWWWGGYPANWLPGCAVTPFGVVCSPYATLLPAGFGPQFGPAGVMPFLGASAGPRVVNPINMNINGGVALASRPRPPAPAAVVPGLPSATVRRVAESGRRRAAALVSAGDRQVRAAAGDAAPLRAALASYRRAAVAERDCPDTFIRQAIVHAALGDHAAGDEALAKAVALDARLGAAAPVDGDARDPIFAAGNGPRRSVLAARGDALIALMAAPEGGGHDSADLAWVARQWSARWGDGPAGLAGLAAAGR